MIVTEGIKERILETAGQVFAEKGFKAATVREICRHADVNIAAVNYYFGDKTRLYIESVKSAHGKVVSGMQEPEWPEDTTPTQKLAVFVRMFVSRLLDPTRPRWHVQLMMREMAQPTAACAELVRDNIRPLAGILMNILEEVLPPNTPRWKRFLVGISIIGQCVIHCQNRPILEQLAGPEMFAHFDADVVAQHITQFSLAALGLGKPLASREASS